MRSSSKVRKPIRAKRLENVCKFYHLSFFACLEEALKVLQQEQSISLQAEERARERSDDAGSEAEEMQGEEEEKEASM